MAAIVVASFSAHTCYVADSISFLASGCLISTLRIAKPAASTLLDAEPAPSPAKRGLRSIGTDMRAGIQVIAHHAGVLFVILALAAGMFLIGCFGPLIAVYVRDSVHACTRVFGVASAMIGLGMFVGVNLLNTFGKKLANSTLVYAGLGGIAFGLCLLAAIAHIWSTILGNLIIGFAVAGVVVPANTMIQQETPHELMGRVGSTVMSLVFTAQIAGLLFSGLLADRIGARHVFAICTVLLACLMAAGRLWMEPEPSA
jgi:MFS family permease